MNIKTLTAALIVASAVGATASQAMAQTAPTYATQDQQIHGRVISFDGAYTLKVRDDQGYVDTVELHQGTIINPTGITLSPGMVVSVDGYNAGSFFAANEVDTPYTFYSGVPYFQGRPWSYYGPSTSLGFFFGSPAWWHGGYHSAPVVVNRGVYVHNNPPPYRGGAWRGHAYVAPPERGGYVPHGQIAHAPAPHFAAPHFAAPHVASAGARGGGRHH
jgi:hypothetical protein